MYDLPLVVAVNTGLPAVVLAFSAPSRFLMAGGIGLVTVGLGQLFLAVRSTRVIDRAFE